MVRLLARAIGVGLETADMLVHEILSRKLRDRRAVARYAGLTGAPDESGSNDPTGLALFAFPKGQRIEPVVSDTNRERRQKAQDNDCGSRAQVAHCPVAAGDHRRGSGWRRITSSVSGNWEKTSSWKLTKASSVSDDDSRWRLHEASLGVATGFENGSAAEECRRLCA